MVCLFKKTADCQCRLKFRRTSLGHRRLRFSFQINDFKDQDRKNRPDCLAPVRGGGGVRDASVFRVKQFFLKNFSNTPETRRPRRRRLSNEDRFLSQPGFSAFSQTRKPKPSNPLRKARRRPSRPARFRASGGYTDPPPSPQAHNDSFTNYLTKPESRSPRKERSCVVA